MRKYIIVLLSVLMLCIIYYNVSPSDVNAQTSYIIDFEDGDTSGTTISDGTSSGSTDTSVSTDSSTSGADATSDTTAGSTSGSDSAAASVSSSTSGSTSDSTSDSASDSSSGTAAASTGITNTTSTSSSFTTESGKDSVDNLYNNNTSEIMGDDWEFGDEILPEVEPEGFFEHVYNKVWEATTGIQKVIGVLLIILFVIAVFMVVVSCFGNKARVIWYVLTMLLIAICFVCDVYAAQIIAAFTNWFTSD